MTNVNETDKNYGLPRNASYGDGNSSEDTDYPRNNMGHRYTEQFLSQTGAVRWGRVIEVYVASRVCLVAHRDGTSACTWLSNHNQYTGVADLWVPPNGSLVQFWKPVGGPGLIMGTYGEPSDEFGIGMDICYVSGNKIAKAFDALTEKRHSFQLEQKFFGMGYANSGRPLDSLPGDMGWMGALGEVIAMLQGVTVFKASECAQIQAFHQDDLLRLIGRNMETWTGGSRSHLVQAGESVNYEFMFADTVPGALGQKESGTSIAEAGGEDDLFQKTKDRDDDPNLRKRLLVQVGHQGNLATIYVCKDKEGEAKHTDSSLYPGIAKIHIGRDGEVSVLSTRSLTFRKVSRIRVPERMKHPFEAEPFTGETTGDETEQFKWVPEGSDGETARALQQLDRDRYKENVYDDKNIPGSDEFHPFEGVVEDTDPPVEEEGELEYRDEQVTFQLGDDGGASITTSAGSSIELTADGDIKIHAARDLFVESGRNTHFFSANDLDIRSKKNTEITSSEESVRMYAKQMMLLHTDERAILLETNSEAGSATGGEPNERENSGIVLRTLKEKGPIILESREDRVIVSSKKDTAFQVLDESSKFYFEGPELFVNLTSGVKSMTVKGDFVDYDLNQSFRVKANGSFLVNLSGGAMGVQAPFISLSAGSFAKFHAPGPGVDVAHTHFGGEFVYAPDAHGIFTTTIIKSNSFQPVPLQDAPDDTYRKNTDPHDPAQMTELVFDWRTRYDIEAWYETTWENKLREDGKDDDWPLLDDDVLGTSPFPGKDLASIRSQYTRSNPKKTPPSGEAGSFGKTARYVVPKEQASGSVDPLDG